MKCYRYVLLVMSFLVAGTLAAISFGSLSIDPLGSTALLIFVMCFGFAVQYEKKLRLEIRTLKKKISDYQFAIDQSSIAVIADASGSITYANEKFCEISKYSQNEILGKNHRFLNSNFHPPEFFDNLWKTISAGKIWRGEIQNVAKDGQLYWVWTVIVPFTDETGTPYQYMSIRSDISERKIYQDKLEKNLKVLRQLSFRLQQAQEDERARISREIHDELGQSLTVLKMEIFLFKKLLSPNSAEALKVQEILLAIERVIQSMRSIVADLRPAMIEDLGFYAATEWWLNGIQKRTGIECKLYNMSQEVSLSTERSIALFRILQELVTNSIRHSGTNKMEIRIEDDEYGIILSVRDFGIGIDLDSIDEKMASGIVGVRERLRPFDGKLRIEVPPTGGTVATAFLPTTQRSSK